MLTHPAPCILQLGNVLLGVQLGQGAGEGAARWVGQRDLIAQPASAELVRTIARQASSGRQAEQDVWINSNLHSLAKMQSQDQDTSGKEA